MSEAIERAIADRRAFAVHFSDLERWDVGSFTSRGWKWPIESLRPLGDVLDRKSVIVRDASDGQLITLRFSGEIEPREGRGASSIKGRLYWAEPGDLVFSKIDVRHGAIGVVPESVGRACVTSEYPVYDVRKDLADPAYVALAVRSEVFRSKVNSLISGASGRKRVQPDDLEALTLPVPPLTAQRAIVAAWGRAQEEGERLRQRAAAVEREAADDFLSTLGLRRPKRVERPRAFAVAWSGFHRWGIEYNQLINAGSDLAAGTYVIVTLGDIVTYSQYGSSKKASTSKGGTPILRMNNIVDGRIVTDDLKYVRLPKGELDSLILGDGDILVNRTNSKELVGKSAVFHLDRDFVYASYLIRFRVELEVANPDYVSHVLNSFIGRQQIDALSRPIGGQANINSEELRSIELPLPPIGVQAALVEAVAERRTEAERLRAEADRQRSRARAATEAMIRGTQPVPTT